MSKSVIKLFYSYSHQDESLCEKMLEHLSLLKRTGVITEWYDRRILAGKPWEAEIHTHIEEADIILLLVSSSFIASDYCYLIEMEKILERQNSGKAIVIPIILSPVEWKDAPFSRLQALPKDGKPITTWDNPNEAWVDVTKNKKKVCAEIKKLNGKPRTGESSTINFALRKSPMEKILSIKPQTAYIYRVAWTADCKYLATGDDDNEIKIWDTKPSKEANVFDDFLEAKHVDTLKGHKDTVKGLAWSPDGKRIASASADKNVFVWDINLDSDIHQQPTHKLRSHCDEINCVFWVTDNRLLSGGDDEEIICWNPETGDKLFQFTNDRERVLCIAVSPDKKLLATGSPDGVVRIWDWQAQTCLYRLKSHQGEIYSVAWASNTILSSGSEDTKVIIWDLDRVDNTPSILEGHNSYVVAVSFSPDHKILASQSADMTLRFWSVEECQPLDYIAYECSIHTDTGMTFMTFDQKLPFLVSLGKKDHVFRIYRVSIDEMIKSAAKCTLDENIQWNKQEKAQISVLAAENYRKRATQVIEATKHYPIPQEELEIDSTNDLERIETSINNCDFFIGIYVFPNDLAWAEYEFQRIGQSGKDAYLFMQEKQSQKKLSETDKKSVEEFRNLLQNSRHKVFIFSDEEDFSVKINEALTERFHKQR